jgi:hypothetical protein
MDILAFELMAPSSTMSIHGDDSNMDGDNEGLNKELHHLRLH